MVTSSSSGLVQLSSQVSEALAFDLGLLPFIRKVLKLHLVGDFSQSVGSQHEFCEESFLTGKRYCSYYVYKSSYVRLDGTRMLIVSPSSRDTSFVAFAGESL